MTAADEWAGLARLAEAATPGPWTYLSRNAIDTPPIDVDEADWGPEGHEGLRIHTAQDTRAYRYADAEFIAAANPATILRLIEELDSAGTSAMNYRDRSSLYREERDELARRLAAVEAAIDRADPPGRMKAGTPSVSVPVLRAALSAAPTDTTKEN